MTGLTTTVAGVKLTRASTKDGTEVWEAVIEGEAWVFTRRPTEQRIWQGFTADHLTGTPRLETLTLAVLWVQAEAGGWQAKLKVRRAKGTRMVDPVTVKA